jgi:hypothetical protein
LRVLFVAMPGSVHAARWINQVSDQGWDVRLFSATPEPIHPDFRNITIYGFSAVRPEGLDRSVKVRGLWPFRRAMGAVGLQAFRYAPRALAEVIRWFKPDVVHTLEVQHAGYLALAARELLGDRFPAWAVSIWGSDLYFFGRLSAHAEKVRSVMSACDYCQTECRRDARLAREFGFVGKGSWVLPGAGGFDIERAPLLRQDGPTSARRLLMLKGYQGWSGRALVGLRAIELCADVLQGYRVAVYSSTPEVQIAAELTSGATGVPIDIVPRSPHEDIMRLHGRARASIGLSISDGIPSATLEAMLMGSFPIQSNTSCIDEMLQDGKTGMFVHPEDPEAVARAIRRAVTDDALVDRAAEANGRLVAERLDQSKVRPRVVAMYESIFAQVVGKALRGEEDREAR